MTDGNDCDAHGLDAFLESLAGAGACADAGSVTRIWTLTAAFFAHNGFDKVIYIDAGPQGTTMLTTLPQEWAARYEAQDYARIDPFLGHCCTTFRPVSTGIAYSESHQYLAPAQIDLIREASDFGINAGMSSTVRLLGPQGAAGWNIGSSQSRAEVDALRADREAALRLAAFYAHEALAQARGMTMLGRLSPRESQCLAYVAQGMRTKDISRKLDLSPSTVELYLRNARVKLGAETREQAAAILAANGQTSG